MYVIMTYLYHLRPEMRLDMRRNGSHDEYIFELPYEISHCIIPSWYQASQILNKVGAVLMWCDIASASY